MTDPLHPLATLHWHQCHEWHNIRPANISILNDTVAVLTQSLGPFDEIFLFSTKLKLRERKALKLRGMSLTTYQSKFVAVGGDQGNCKYSDELITSDDGLEWQPLLPPMPTKRAYTSSVSITSPDRLVVAGGWGPDVPELDIVEILIEDNWYTAKPLPFRCYSMHCTVHNGHLYIIGGRYQDKHIYHCNCNSLISWCQMHTEKDDTIALWTTFEAPVEFTASVICSSRLLTIDGQGIVRGYSNKTKSWLEVTSSGLTHDLGQSVAAAILPSGEIVCALKTKGVHRIHLSVSPFDQEQKFFSNTITRLEAVMEFPIKSSLATKCSQLISASGIKKQTQIHNVEEVFYEWSAGRSERFPTWKQLFQVLQEIDLKELSQHIRLYFKCESPYIDAYQHYISTKETLDLLFLKILFLGPPRLGKTTTLRRIMGLIIDLLSAGEANVVHPSTGVVETGHNMLVQGAVLTGTEWSPIKNLIDEACMIFHNLVDDMETKKMSTISHNSPVVDTAAINNSPKNIRNDITFSKQSNESEPGSSTRQNLLSAFHGSNVQISSETDLSIQSENISRDIPKLVSLFEQAVEQPQFWKEIQQSFHAYVRLEDTGGHSELVDMLPALTMGPGLYLLFFSYELNLKSEFPVYYQKESGKSSSLIPSVVTLEEMLLSSLSSISNSSTCGVYEAEEGNNNPDMNSILESSKSVVYIVGTHKDKVSKQHISCFDMELQTIIRDTDFFDKELVQFFSEDKLIVSMDNMSGGSKEVKEVRELLEGAMKKHFKKLKIPGVWLLFSLCLRSTEMKTASLKYCVGLAKQFGMSYNETKVALWFLHHHAGVLMYFPGVTGIEELIIIDNQIIFDSVTNLILKAMTFENVGQKKAERFRETGHFMLQELTAAGEFIPPIKLVALLEYLHIVVKISEATCTEEVVYMMPCVLLHASKEKLDSASEAITRPRSIAPLTIRYKCGYVPTGVFPALVASLIGNTSFSLVQDGRMYKNLAQFRYGSLYTLVTFISQPKFYEIIISELPVIQCKPYKVCIAIRKEVETMFEKVSSRMNYGYFMDYQFGFECPSHPGKQHLCVVEDSLEIMLCLKVLTNKKPIPMEDHHKIWFQKPFNPTEAAVSSHPEMKNLKEDLIPLASIEGEISQSSSVSMDSANHLSRNLSLSPEDGTICEKNLNEVFKAILGARVKWKYIGLGLGVDYGTLQVIKSNHNGDADNCCLEMLHTWLTGSSEKTWNALADALESDTVGHPDLAKEVRKRL